MNKRIVAIIGGGASGLIASIIIKKRISDCDVLVIEKNDKTGKKILATGNGKCNISNKSILKENYYCSDSFELDKVVKILDDISNEDIIDFFSKIGLECFCKDNGRIYPTCEQASSVLDCLREEMKHLNVKEICNTEVSRIEKNQKFYVYTKSNKDYIVDSVIIATGGKASPFLGSDGSGYDLAKGFGHKVSDVYPAIVHMKSDDKTVKALKGIKVNATASLFADEFEAKQEYGEVLFTENGLSGPPIFQLSTFIAECKIRNVEFDFKVMLDLLPEIRLSELIELLTTRKENIAYRQKQEFLNGLINKRIGQQIIKQCDFKADYVSQIKKQGIEQIARQIKGFKINIQENMPFLKAQVTAGGVLLNGFDEKLESKYSDGLFACGEVLDVFGDCGGYNLQWAWSSGMIAANAAVGYLERI